MSLRSYSLRTRSAAVVVTAGLLSLTGAAVAAGTASADAPAIAGPVTKSVTFSCEFPLVGVKKVPVDVSLNFPDSGKVGEVIQVTDLKVDGKLDADITSAMQLIGAKTVEATDVSTDVDVKINDTELGVTLNGLNMPQVPVPDSGDTPFSIFGPIPGLTVKSPGSVSFAIGKKFVAQKVTPKDANGQPTDLGTFPLNCTQDEGQDTALATIPVS
ncbi:DUF6801 domain-containing protein [Amycolatopsis anabasis]|uniref:DUF6801 domain-containing protein n=1 Tax=Amycolatopsis anabasis TaxID=1840409 RepID=UPI00131C2051|nr:DUF6801 domain-containing protein [Amycolatopsis anabasis]